MTLKLPIILSTMIAALATPDALASQADSATSDAGGAMAAAPDAGAMATSDTTATSDNTAAPDATAPAAKPAAKKKDGKHHRKHHRKHRRGSSGPGHTPDKWDAPYDEVTKDAGDGCSGSPSDDSGRILPEETPGQRGPKVPPAA